MKKDKKKIAFDFDGVIADTTNKKKKWLESKKIFISGVDKTTFFKELEKSMNIVDIKSIYTEMSNEIFTEKTLLETKPIKDAIKTLKELSKIYDIYIITARTEALILSVNKWLNLYNIKNCIKEIKSASFKNKQEICKENNIEFLCDDDIRHLSDNIIDERVLFCNRDVNLTDNNIKLVSSWKEIFDLLVT